MCRVSSPNERPWLRVVTGALAVLTVAGLLTLTGPTSGFERYNDGCQSCHGAFTDGTSPTGATFPNDSKHTMHRGAQYMNTECDLCHTTGDENNPFIGSSDGTNDTPGVGCTGCHGRDYGGDVGSSGVGLRAHHAANGVEFCAGCHMSDPVPLPEDVAPLYYGSVDTNAFDPCNAAPGLGESWSLGDEIGLDNDGDNLYDGDDPDCSGGKPCPEDTDGNGAVDVDDLIAVILDWNTDGSSNNGDVDGSGLVDVDDLVAVILAWGLCP